jgi:two-component system, OmpR family, sensor histidine kinase KdpD
MAKEQFDLEARRRAAGERALAEVGTRARLLVYIAAAPGAGKTRRLLDDARRAMLAGRNVRIGWIEPKGRTDLEQLASVIPRIPARMVKLGDDEFPEFDFEETVREHPDVIVLDELAHDNLPGSTNAKRWQDALALRERGISVIGAFNVAHLDTAAPQAQVAIGFPVREIVPISFLKSADEVIALDASPQLLERRLRSERVVAQEDIDRALAFAFKPQTLYVLRELLLRTIDELTIPAVSADAVSTAAAIVLPGFDPAPFLRRTAAIAWALDLKLDVHVTAGISPDVATALAREDQGAEVFAGDLKGRPEEIDALRASLVAVPMGALARELASAHVSRDIFVAGTQETFIGAPPISSRLTFTLGDRMRVGYGKLTVYLGATAGCGKTYAMLDRAQQLKSEGVDVVAAFVETHGRKETAAMAEGLETLPRKRISAGGITYEELDRDALVARKPKVGLVDELAHTNAPGSPARKRYEDVLAVLRAGIDVITTLNIQHLEALGDAVYRLTGTIVRETLPDGILALADEVILIDITPEALQQRLLEGKIYPPDRIEASLAGFFRLDNLRALRELAIREAIRARNRTRGGAPFERLLLTVAPRESDVALVERCSQIAQRLGIDFAVAHVALPNDRLDADALAKLEAASRSTGTWRLDRGDDPPRRVIEIARERPETTVAVGGTLRMRPRWPQPKAYARRLIDCGARELLILARRAPG